jgi:Carboxypeptidase regulatory-like domain
MKHFFLAVAAILVMSAAADAQTFRGAINGVVTDPSGGAVPNAQVKAVEVATGLEHATTATGDGAFAFQDIPLGFYKVTVTAPGFPPYTVDKVEVVAGTIYTLNIKLSLGQQATTVEVSAAALTLDTTTQTQTMTLSEDIVQDIPLNGRDFTQMISVSPGFGGYNVGGFGSLNGTRPNQINWQIDGVDNNDFWHNIPAVNQGGVSGIAGVVLPIDSVTEFSAQTSSGPEGGRNAGGTVNVVTKSGSNEIHGSLYYYNRNEAFGDPSPFFAPSATVPKAPPERNENYGFSVGGPIIKNKTFYFASYEKQQFIFGLSGIATEPSDAWINKALAVLGAHGVAESAASATAVGPNGFWPRSIIGGLPATTNNFFSPSAETGYSYNGVVRLDQQITDKHHLYLRWFGGQGNQIAPLGGSPALGTASSNLAYYFEVAPIHVFNYSAVLNSTLTTKLTNQLLFGANYFNQIFHDNNNSFDTKAMGLFLSPDATNAGKYVLGAPNIQIAPPAANNVSGFEQIGLTPPEGRNDLTWHITDVISHSVGAHQLRYGAEVRQAHLNEFYHRRGTGKFTFDGTQGPWANDASVDPLTKALADFLAGDVSSSTIAVGNIERWVTVNAFNAYFQDSWQLTKKLNFNYGLRYEYFGPMSSDRKDIANFIPGQGFVVQDGSHPLFKPGKAHFAPRLGFAYQPMGRSDLVVRGGFGVFYDQINLNPFLDFRPPIAAPQGIEGNPAGASPVSTYTLSGYQWDAVQAGNASIFPGVHPCSTLNVATQTSSDNCGVANYATGANLYGVYSVSPNFRTPYFFNYNLQVEKGFGNVGVWQIGYVGSAGRKLNIISNINPSSGSGAQAFFGPLNTTYPNVGNVLQLNTIGTSNYNALQTIFRTRNWHRFSSQFAYTWSHALDEISEYRGAILDDYTNPKLDYGNSDFDTRNLFTIDFTYDVPDAPWATSAVTKRVFNGWQVSSVMNWHSGQPSDELRLGLDLISDPFKGLSHSFDKSIPGIQWLNPSAFCSPGGSACPTASGNLARNKFAGPGFRDVDLSFIKSVPLTERVKIQLRADFFNLLNHINFASGVGSVGSSCAPNKVTGICTGGSGFGQVTDTIGDFNGAPAIGPGEARNVQLVAKIIF